MTWLPLAVILFLAVSVHGAPGEDEVLSLPGLKKQPFWKHYSGYLKASGTKHLHYWFIESDTNPVTDPVVLWLNGGPGCSSLLGLLTENGPFKVTKNTSDVTYNQYSWNNKANMLYLEAPAGVGFSYSDDKNYTTDDDQVSLDNLLALHDFFTKFPEYKSNDFYITGESYGGVYVPTLAVRVLSDRSINFKGMAIGNGISNFDMNENSFLYFGYYHGLIGDSLWNKTLNACCPEGSERCPFIHRYLQNQMCLDYVEACVKLVYNTGLNQYNLYGPCLVPKPDGYIYKDNTFIYDIPPFAFRNHPFMRQKLETIRLKRQLADSVRSTPTCLDDGTEIAYLNSEEVRKALHIPDVVQKWDVCSDAVGSSYKTLYHDVKPQYMQVLQNTKRILVYNGDVDMSCNFLGDEWFVEDLNQPVTAARAPWYYTDTAGLKQVAGFVKKFQLITLTTVRGSGHMVPQDKPLPALLMFNDFLQNQ